MRRTVLDDCFCLCIVYIVYIGKLRVVGTGVIVGMIFVPCSTLIRSVSTPRPRPYQLLVTDIQVLNEGFDTSWIERDAIDILQLRSTRLGLLRPCQLLSHPGLCGHEHTGNLGEVLIVYNTSEWVKSTTLCTFHSLSPEPRVKSARVSSVRSLLTRIC